jgi:tyrosinase
MPPQPPGDQVENPIQEEQAEAEAAAEEAARRQKPLPSNSKRLPAVLRLRKSVTQLSSAEVAGLRSGISKMVSLSDDRGYEFWAGIHGLPLPTYCQHGSPLFLPWHRAYLYHFEQYLLDQEPNVSLPWWDWSTQQGIPEVYADATVAGGATNPLASAPVSGIPDSQFQALGESPITQTSRAPGPNATLPSPGEVASVLDLDNFLTFTDQLETMLHNRVHVWAGGSMGLIPVAAYDPLFWAHHTMVDRLWALWQQSHPGAELGGGLTVNTSIPPPFGMTIGQVLSIATLGYEYAAASSSATP